MKTLISLLCAALLLSGCMQIQLDEEPRAVQTSGIAPESTENLISKEEAQAIALNHAGFTADQVNWLRANYELDDGIPQYEVEFHQGIWEYDYEIDARTGEVLSYDRDD